MTFAKFELGMEKTEVLFQSLLRVSAPFNCSLRHIGVIFDQSYFDQHMNLLTCSCFFHLRTITKLKAVLSQPELQTIISASLDHLQQVQNAAAKKEFYSEIQNKAHKSHKKTTTNKIYTQYMFNRHTHIKSAMEGSECWPGPQESKVYLIC